MASNRDESLSFMNVSTSASTPIASSENDSYLLDSSQIGSASGSFQNDGFLASLDAGGGAGGNIDLDAEFGFSRPDFKQESLVGTVEFCERHVFLCYKNPRVWPPRIEAAEFDRLPRLLSAALCIRKSDLKRQTRLTVCEGRDGTDTSNGDVLIFPDMVRYRKLTHFDVDTFVEEVLVKDGEWLPGIAETLKGWYIFVCCHGSRDRRCGVCGPALLSRFSEEIALCGLQNKVSVSACSHIGGHKYAGNVIIFGPNLCKQVSGHWYGYVSPDDVPILLEQHIIKGQIVDWLWRGQMGLSEEEQKRAQALRTKDLTQIDSRVNTCTSQAEGVGCCQENGSSFCCQNPVENENYNHNEETTSTRLDAEEYKSLRARGSTQNDGKGVSSRKQGCDTPLFESWEREDTYAVLAVAAAIASVAFAYSCYKQLN